jgi:putative hemolysin
MDGDELASHRTAVLHAGETDVPVADLEVLSKVPDHLGVRDTLLLKKEVEMVSTTTRLIEREFLDEKVFISELDAPAQVGS